MLYCTHSGLETEKPCYVGARIRDGEPLHILIIGISFPTITAVDKHRVQNGILVKMPQVHKVGEYTERETERQRQMREWNIYEWPLI